MMQLFKNELTYEDINYRLTYKELLTLRDIRLQQLEDERKAAKEEAERKARENIRNNIMAK